MGRPKKSRDQARVARLHVRMRQEYLDWLTGLADEAGDKNVAAMIERWAAKDAKRLKYPPPPPR